MDILVGATLAFAIIMMGFLLVAERPSNVPSRRDTRPDGTGAATGPACHGEPTHATPADAGMDGGMMEAMLSDAA